jgi:hypothetical protein
MEQYFRPDDGNSNDLRILSMQGIMEEGKAKGLRNRIEI